MNLNNILFSIYTGEYPNQFAGGPNNIIYKLIKNYDGTDFQFDFLSSSLYHKSISRQTLDTVSNNLPQGKKLPHTYQKIILFTVDYLGVIFIYHSILIRRVGIMAIFVSLYLNMI